LSGLSEAAKGNFGGVFSNNNVGYS